MAISNSSRSTWSLFGSSNKYTKADEIEAAVVTVPAAINNCASSQSRLTDLSSFGRIELSSKS
jgi:hypothetical protein